MEKVSADEEKEKGQRMDWRCEVFLHFRLHHLHWLEGFATDDWRHDECHPKEDGRKDEQLQETLLCMDCSRIAIEDGYGRWMTDDDASRGDGRMGSTTMPTPVQGTWSRGLDDGIHNDDPVLRGGDERRLLVVERRRPTS